jgi:BTB/POZ domain
MQPVSNSANLACNNANITSQIAQQVHPQEEAFFCLALVNKTFFKTCKEFFPLIDKDAFYSKFMTFIKVEDAWLNFLEPTRRHIFKLFYNKNSRPINSYDPLPLYAYKNIVKIAYWTQHSIAGGGYSYEGKYHSKNYTQEEINLEFLEFIRSYKICCGLDLTPCKYSGDFNWIFRKEIMLDSHYTFSPPEDKPATSLPAIPQRGYEFFQNEILTDCKIICGAKKESFQAHRLVLAMASEELKIAFTSGMSETASKNLFFPEDVNTVKFFINYLYQGKKFFDANIKKEMEKNDDKGIDLCALMGIAHRYGVKDLFRLCEKYIAENMAAEDWEAFIELGLRYESKLLVGSANAHRIRLEQALPLEMKEGVKKLDLPYTFPSQDVVVDCNVGYGNTLGVCDSELWCATTPFTWTPKGWVGNVPIGTEFKFVCLRPNQAKVIWEEKQGNRILSEDTNGCLKIKDVSFKL